MNRWLILILFVLALVSGHLAFAYTPTSTLWPIDAIFLASVIIFLMGFVQLTGQSLNSDIDRYPRPPHSEPAHEHAHSHSRETHNDEHET